MTDDLVNRLREVAIEKQSEACGRVDGGQDFLISAMLAEECADRISAQAAEIERLATCEKCRNAYAETERMRVDLRKAVDALQIARVHVAKNAEGWGVGRVVSRGDLMIVDFVLSVLTGAKP